MLALQWRKRLTLAAHSRYCRDSNVFYLMKEGAEDNPDQRVAQVGSDGLSILVVYLMEESRAPRWKLQDH